ncbi:hypothetical protein NECAME_07219 [Necator americanus]|uniref:Uncharacterized protein n=1 Tax=Necator americanus TaxID=51031 RepID=W2TNY8_NECAM|nr:hypothetical protein NECAME_07219 [Necator americanus]ETN83790.1 hypothetical protein NECAME_07219 [Necator americanus]
MSEAMEEAPKEFVKKKYEPKKLHTNEVASLFDLKSEYLKKKNDIVQSASGEIYRGGRSNVLAINKEEKISIKREEQERKRRINESEAALRKEEEERLDLVRKKLKEKSELYEKLSEGKVVLEHSNGLDVEFLVDFNAKVEEHRQNQLKSNNNYHEEEPTTSADVQPTTLVEHYVPEEEKRVYGVSHMKFSTDEEKRQAQIKSLYNMTAETAKMRAKNKSEADEKARAKREKLNALRRRKGVPEIRTPSPEPEPEEPELNLEEIPLPIEKPLKDREHKTVREWDRGKGRYNTWIQKQRDERDEEFAPPSFYYQ